MSWKEPMHGGDIRCLAKKLKQLKLVLRNWNKSRAVKLFLDRGARTSVDTGDGRLPLDIVLEAISLNYLRLQNWSQKMLKRFSLYPISVEDGSLVHLAALLMAAREKLLEPISGNEIDAPILEQHIMKALA
ncbi:hypothetical protein ACH5RR_032765 [Cinchona calisaya]|uniref:Uncharacterized protein n=1 Tax=Cinchona calisaya TaxID=153742 RepID=A0ABD2YK63_9GENT